MILKNHSQAIGRRNRQYSIRVRVTSSTWYNGLSKQSIVPSRTVYDSRKGYVSSHIKHHYRGQENSPAHTGSVSIGSRIILSLLIIYLEPICDYAEEVFNSGSHG